MRKILTPEEIEKRDKRRNGVISIILLGIMLLSTLGFAFVYNSDSSTTQVSGSQVQPIGGKWVASFGSSQLVFSTSPESINSTQNYVLVNLNQYYNRTLYVDSNSDEVYYEIGSTLGQYTQRTQHACYSGCDNSTYPVKTCDDNLIVYIPKNENKVYQNKSCVFIEGDISAADAFLYKIFGLA